MLTQFDAYNLLQTDTFIIGTIIHIPKCLIRSRALLLLPDWCVGYQPGSAPSGFLQGPQLLQNSDSTTTATCTQRLSTSGGSLGATRKSLKPVVGFIEIIFVLTVVDICHCYCCCLFSLSVATGSGVFSALNLPLWRLRSDITTTTARPSHIDCIILTLKTWRRRHSII